MWVGEWHLPRTLRYQKSIQSNYTNDAATLCVKNSHRNAFVLGNAFHNTPASLFAMVVDDTALNPLSKFTCYCLLHVCSYSYGYVDFISLIDNSNL